ncbi:MAG: pantoate--beta-alanine ligase [Bacteroidota bacterium]
MLVFDKIKELKQHLALKRLKGATVGFVPTMGALHEGHISLIGISKKETDITVCSIFVNPTQFNNAGDLTKYPRTPQKDIALLEAAGCDVLYMPDVKDVYPENDTRKFNFGYLDTILEGEHRPGHFNGVGQVVSILLEGVDPDKAYFGSKDYQQVMVVKDLVKQLHLRAEIVACPILREADGLAMSSRNMRLNPEERKVAGLVPIMMQKAREIVKQKGILAAKAFITDFTNKQPLMKLDYYEVCNANTLEPLKDYSSQQQAISLIAVFVGNVRLIDNWPV